MFKGMLKKLKGGVKPAQPAPEKVNSPEEILEWNTNARALSIVNSNLDAGNRIVPVGVYNKYSLRSKKVWAYACETVKNTVVKRGGHYSFSSLMSTLLDATGSRNLNIYDTKHMFENLPDSMLPWDAYNHLVSPNTLLHLGLFIESSKKRPGNLRTELTLAFRNPGLNTVEKVGTDEMRLTNKCRAPHTNSVRVSGPTLASGEMFEFVEDFLMFACSRSTYTFPNLTEIHLTFNTDEDVNASRVIRLFKTAVKGPKRGCYANPVLRIDSRYAYGRENARVVTTWATARYLTPEMSQAVANQAKTPAKLYMKLDNKAYIADNLLLRHPHVDMDRFFDIDTVLSDPLFGPRVAAYNPDDDWDGFDEKPNNKKALPPAAALCDKDVRKTLLDN
jgi:hypothetical protein